MVKGCSRQPFTTPSPQVAATTMLASKPSQNGIRRTPVRKARRGVLVLMPQIWLAVQPVAGRVQDTASTPAMDPVILLDTMNVNAVLAVLRGAR